MSNIPVNSLTSLSSERFMLRPAGPRKTALNHPHRDDYYIFGVLLSGTQTFSVDFRDISMSGRQAIVISPGQVHRPDGDLASDGFVIIFAPEMLTETETSLIEEYSLGATPITLSEDDFADIKSLYSMLLRRIDMHTDVELSIASAIKNIILQRIVMADKSVPGRYLRLAVGLKRLLIEHIATEKSPSAYAAMLNVSGVYLNEAIRNVTGISVHRYIISFAMLSAKRDLVYTDLPAQEIARRLGYDDYSYFSRMFHRHTGMSPRAFRSKYLK